MIPRHVMTAVALLVAVNLLVFFGVARNRLGSPRAQLQLTEREVQLSIASEDDENSGVGLWLNLNDDNDEETWFDSTVLKAFGFDVEPITDDDKGWALQRRALPRQGYAVLEYEGSAWQNFVERLRQQQRKIADDLAAGRVDEEKAQKRRERLEQRLVSASRLFAIAAGPDAAALRERYPDRGRYAVVPVQVRLRVDRSDMQTWDYDDIEGLSDGQTEKSASTAKPGYRLYGTVNRVLVNQFYLDRNQQQILAEAIAAEREQGYRYSRSYHDGEPRYKVQIAWGQRLEPWVADVAPWSRDAG